MRISYLKYLADIAKTHSINKSAENFYISHQSMSKAIKNLENILNQKVLVRNHSGVELTEVGQIVVESSKDILDDLDKMGKKIKAINNKVYKDLKGNVKVKSNFQAISSVVPPIIEMFSIKYPNIILQVDIISAFNCVKEVYEDRADIALIGIIPNTVKLSKEYEQMLNSLEVEKLYRDNMYVGLNSKSEYVKKGILTLDDLKKIKQISYIKPLMKELLFADDNDRQLVETSSTVLFEKLIKEGVGYGFFNGLNIKLNYKINNYKDIAFLPFADDNNILDYLLVYKKNNDKILNLFIEDVKQTISYLT